MNVLYLLVLFKMHFHCYKFSKITATGIKRALMSVGRSHRHIRSRHIMTQSRAYTPVRAFAQRDQCFHNVATPTEPRTSVSAPHSLIFTLKYLTPCFFIHCLLYAICSFKEEDPSFHLWLSFLWHHSCFHRMRCPKNLS